MTETKYNGLKKRESYDQIIENLQNLNDIKLPDRKAKILRNSFQLSNLLDGDGMGFADMEKIQTSVMKEQQK